MQKFGLLILVINVFSVAHGVSDRAWKGPAVGYHELGSTRRRLEAGKCAHHIFRMQRPVAGFASRVPSSSKVVGCPALCQEQFALFENMAGKGFLGLTTRDQIDKFKKPEEQYNTWSDVCQASGRLCISCRVAYSHNLDEPKTARKTWSSASHPDHAQKSAAWNPLFTACICEVLLQLFDVFEDKHIFLPHRIVDLRGLDCAPASICLRLAQRYPDWTCVSFSSLGGQPCPRMSNFETYEQRAKFTTRLDGKSCLCNQFGTLSCTEQRAALAADFALKMTNGAGTSGKSPFQNTHVTGLQTLLGDHSVQPNSSTDNMMESLPDIQSSAFYLPSLQDSPHQDSFLAGPKQAGPNTDFRFYDGFSSAWSFGSHPLSSGFVEPALDGLERLPSTGWGRSSLSASSSFSGESSWRFPQASRSRSLDEMSEFVSDPVMHRPPEEANPQDPFLESQPRQLGNSPEVNPELDNEDLFSIIRGSRGIL